MGKKEVYSTPHHFGTEFRRSAKALQDGLSQEDSRWYVCRRTGRGYQDLLAIMGECSGDLTQFCEAIGYRNLRRVNKYDDFGWWQTIAAWIRLWQPQWEKFLKDTVTRLVSTDLTLPDQQDILETVANALGLAPETLLNLAQNLDTMEAFMASNRRMLGVLAEQRLWTLVAQGDAATIRWLLPRINTDAFGDKLTQVPGDKVKEIKIIEVE
jgi:hypothetical protein